MSRPRTGRSAKSYARREAVREPYPTVLIVCEGKKTEPTYLHGLRNAYRLSSANIEITSADGTDPVSVASYAMTRVGEYDCAYCVFDRNGHENYEAALRKISDSRAGREGRLIGIPSWPCFEVWLLLHFTYTTAPFNPTSSKSSCDMVVRALRQHLPAYSKGQANIFESVSNKLDDALKNADLLEQHNRGSASSNPATRMHLLVEYLIALKGAAALRQ